jgi:hypothetical protein
MGMKKIALTLFLLLVSWKAVLTGWDAWVEFDGIFHNGTNKDDDAARMAWFLITVACFGALLASVGGLVGVWSKKPEVQGGP